ncbi:MAG: hypothetical protein K2Y22_16755 [Candidatus Obscuribacterales bacterium]|nr:hypothetical protein [Candidatus Obscuribacterales bacterium]
MSNYEEGEGEGQPREQLTLSRTNTNASGDQMAYDIAGQIIEFKYCGQPGSFKILQQDHDHHVTEFRAPNGSIYSNFHGAWECYDPANCRTSGCLSQTDVTIDETGLHVDSRVGRDFLGLPSSSMRQ